MASGIAPPAAKCSPVFATTHWSVVLAARDRGDLRASQSLETLCRVYWYPIYAYVRRCGYDATEAEDLTQEFFFRLLDKNYLAQVDPGKGRFRSFLLVAIKHFLSNERDRARAVKRGGRVTFVSVDEINAEGRYQHEPAMHLSPEKLFEQRWALALLEQVLAKLRGDFAAKGKEALFDELKVYLTGSKKFLTYSEQAARLGMTEAAVKMTVQRMRKRYAELLREEIAHTVARPDEVQDEIRHLFAILGER